MLTDMNSVRKHMSLDHLNDTECEKILQVLQKDFELRQKEKERLSRIEEDLEEEEKKKDVIAKKTNLNENVCIRCCRTFGLIFNRRQTCQKCGIYVCKSCCLFDTENKGYVCSVCIKELELKLQSCDWFYNNVSKKFKRFGSAKVVRSLYKQKGDRARRYHSDNESDSGYDPSLYSSLKSRSQQRFRAPVSGVFSHSDDEFAAEIHPLVPPPPQFDSSIFEKPVPPPGVLKVDSNVQAHQNVTTSDSNVQTLSTGVTTADSNIQAHPVIQVDENIQADRETKELHSQEVQADQDERTRDIYKEAFESTKETEGNKFRGRFQSLLSELRHSLQNQSPHGVTCNSSYGQVMVRYTNRLSELLLGVSQRLELAIDSFDSFPSQSPTSTSDKVKQLVSKLVETSFGESIDLTSDEAVSDLSSLSEDDSEHQKSFEDQLAQAVIGKVLEKYRKDSGFSGLGIDLENVHETKRSENTDVQLDDVDQGHGDSLQNSDIEYSDAVSRGDVAFPVHSHKYHLKHGRLDSLNSNDSQSEYSHDHVNTLRRDSVEQAVDITDGYPGELRDNSEQFPSHKKSRDSLSKDSPVSRKSRHTDNLKKESPVSKKSKHQTAEISPREAKITSSSSERNLSYSHSSDEDTLSGEENLSGETVHRQETTPQRFSNVKGQSDHQNTEEDTPQHSRRLSSRGQSDHQNTEDTSRHSSSHTESPHTHHKERLKPHEVPHDDEDVLVDEDIVVPKCAKGGEYSPNSNDYTSPQNEEISKAQISVESNVNDPLLLEPRDPAKDIAHLRSFLNEIKPRPQLVEKTVDEEVIEEGPIEKVNVDREEQQNDFLTRFSSLSRVHESSSPLPNFDVSDFELNPNEVDPDLLSMNLAPILEEDEDNYEEEEEEPHKNGEGDHWKSNWLFKGGSTVSPYDNMGRRKVGGDLGHVYMTIPEPYMDITPRVGNRARLFQKPQINILSPIRDAEECPSDLSDEGEVEDENLSDEENSFYSKTSEEIARITRKSSLTNQASIQTDDSDLDLTRDRSSSDAGIKGRSSRGESSADESQIPKKKLIEELIPAEGDDPKFEIPPESVTIMEGEPAKFMCRVAGTNPVNVYWYKADGDLEEIEDSVQFDIMQEGNRHHMTMYNAVKADAGQFMAIAINEKGKSCQYLILHVKKNTQELKAPEFLKGIQDVEVFEGQTVKFRCKVKGYPQPRVVWYKDGHKLSSRDNCRLEKYGNRDYILTIDCATLDEDAEYSVVAKNIAGEVKSSAQLIVEQELPDNTINSKMSFQSYSWSTSFAEDKKMKTSSPETSKDNQQLTNIGRKMMISKDNVTDVAEDMLSNASKLSDLHRSLDQVDDMLSYIEKDVRPDNSTEDWSDDFLSHNLCSDAVDSYMSMRNAAKNVRDTTNSALNILNTTGAVIGHENVIKEDNVIGSENQESDCLATSTPRQEVVDDQSNNNISEVSTNQVLKEQEPVQYTGSVEANNFTAEIDYPANQSYNSQVTIIPSFMQQRSRDSQNNDLPTSNESSFSYSDDLNSSSGSKHEHTVVNTGPKRIESDYYNRDFYINQTPKPRRKKWEVKTGPSPTAEVVNRNRDLQNTEDKIYMAAGQVYHLEDRIHDLESKVNETNEKDKRHLSHLEDEVARTVAQVHHSEQEVTAIEQSVKQLHVSTSPRHSAGEDNSSNISSPSLSVDSGFSSVRERPLPTHLIGQTSEDDLPESRTEFNADASIELPSVSRLKAMFGATKSPADESSLRRKGERSEAVQSITGRNFQKSRIAKSRQRQGDDDIQVSHTSHMTVSLAHTPVNQSREEAVQVFPKTQGAFFPEDAKSEQPKTTPESFNVRDTASVSQPAKTTVSFTINRPTQQSVIQSEPSINTVAGSNEEQSVKKSKPRVRSGCTAARASFWERRIQGNPNEVSLEEYPEMVEDIAE